MAYDKIRVIHTRLDNSLRYVMNAEKTVDNSTGSILIGGINCLPETAYRDMMQTKHRWDKTNRRIQGYHVIHSFAPGEVTPEKAQAVSVPLIAESPVNIECRVKDVLKLGSHHMFLAEVLAVDVDESLLDMGGRLALEKAEPVVYSHGEYYGLSELMGTFGWSVRKKKRGVHGKKNG